MSKKVFILCVLAFVIWMMTSTAGESSMCLAVYKEGGAPAVFQSPKCPTWTLPKPDHQRQSTNWRCQAATRQGRRNYLEDRTFCTLDIRIPFPDQNGIRETSVGIVAVFDGHNGAEASEMASNLLLEYFIVHTYFHLETAFSFLSKTSKGMLPTNNEKPDEHVIHLGRVKFTLSSIFDGSFHLEILKESLLRAIGEIDATFFEEASRNSSEAGSTATVILLADDQILVANIGDSKAFLCSKTFQSPTEAKATLMRLYQKRRSEGASVRMKDFKLSASSDGLTYFSAKELTKDHHPDRADERSRVESSGGQVIEWAGVSRVNGQLAVSRSIGDVSYKRYGVIAVPEVTDWRPVTANDSYLVATSDGVHERLTPQDVCDVLWDLQSNGTRKLVDSSSCLYSLADCIVDTALERGSMDNVAAVVVPFGLEALPSERSSGVRLHESYLDGPTWMKEYTNLNRSCTYQI